MSYLKPEHQQRIADAYHAFADNPGFACTATLEEIRLNDGNLSIPLYVRGRGVGEAKGAYAADGLKQAVRAWEQSSVQLNAAVNALLQRLS
jgi:type I restriction enzyme M protein